MVEQKAKLQQQEAAPKRAEKTRMAAPKCATQKKLRLLCRTRSIDVQKYIEKQTLEQQTVELTTFRPEALFGKRKARQYEKTHEFMKKKR